MRLRSCGMSMALRVNGAERKWVRLDTDCAGCLQWVTSEVKPEQWTPQMAVGLARTSIPPTSTTVAIGAHQFENVPAGLHWFATFPGESGLCGNGLLSRFSAVTIDTNASHLTLEDQSPVHKLQLVGLASVFSELDLSCCHHG